MKGATFVNIGTACFTIRLNDLVNDDNNPISVYVAASNDSKMRDQFQLSWLCRELLGVPWPLGVEGPPSPRARRRCPLQDVERVIFAIALEVI